MPRRKNYQKNKIFKGGLSAILKIVGIFILIFFIFGVGIFLFFAKDLPDPSRIDQRQITQSTKIYDRTGEVVLYDIHGEEKRTVIPFSSIPKSVKNATIAIEDQNFYSHPGVDIRAVITALISGLKGDRLRGASTITQQFIKNSILSPERTLTRKIKEAILALELERKYEKDEILGFYLNQIPYGSNAYGIEAAAQTFFSKHAQELTLSESALLASLPKAPTYYSPYGSHKDELIFRRNLTLRMMKNMGFITPEEEEEARDEELDFSKVRTSIDAPHFIFYVREILEEKYGEDYLSQAGLKVISTIDSELQEAAEEIVKKRVEENQHLGAYNASLVAIDPKTGQILAMVGSKDYFADPLPEGCTPGISCKFEPHVNVSLRGRQPGSAFKPFIYATAFKEGYTDKTIVFDLSTEFNPSCDSFSHPEYPGAECYRPGNFDGTFRGPVTLRSALANSINIPAVKTLYLAGIDDSIDTAQDMGITTLKDRSRFGLSLVLGGGEVRLLDITSAFGVFANEGVRQEIVSILKIEDGEGEVIEKFEDKSTQVLDAEITRQISDILSDNIARTPVFGPSSPLAFSDRDVAAKTGSTNEFRDGWTVGYTPSLAVGVWAGNNDNSPINNKPGVVVASPMWREFLLKAFEVLDLPKESFTPPQPVERSKPILSGQYVVDGDVHSILYYIDKNDPLGAPPSKKDIQFKNWEKAASDWWQDGYSSNTSISILSPEENEEVDSTGFTIEVNAKSEEELKKVEFFFNDKLIGVIEGPGPNYILNYSLPLGVSSGEHTIKIHIYGESLFVFKEALRKIIIP